MHRPRLVQSQGLLHTSGIGSTALQHRYVHVGIRQQNSPCMDLGFSAAPLQPAPNIARQAVWTIRVDRLCASYPSSCAAAKLYSFIEILDHEAGRLTGYHHCPIQTHGPRCAEMSC
jgi:hypothetical protein